MIHSVMSLKSVSKSVPGILGKTFQRKYIALGRIVTRWSEIIGPDFAERAQPAKIRYFKPKQPREKPSATLEIAASSADCSVLVYQKDVILQRINQIFGEQWVTDIKFIHHESRIPVKPQKRTKNLTETEKNHLSQLLEGVSDPDIKESLTRFGQAFLQDKKK
jgi:hypothetical protein